MLYTWNELRLTCRPLRWGWLFNLHLRWHILEWFTQMKLLGMNNSDLKSLSTDVYKTFCNNNKHNRFRRDKSIGESFLQINLWSLNVIYVFVSPSYLLYLIKCLAFDFMVYIFAEILLECYMFVREISWNFILLFISSCRVGCYMLYINFSHVGKY